MYTRELQNNMSILNVFKQTGQVSNEKDSSQFGNFMNKKNEGILSNKTENATFNRYSRKENAHLDLKSSDSIKPLKRETSEPVERQNSSERTESPKVKELEQKTEVKPVKKTSSEPKEDVSIEEEDVKNELMKKLKISEDELNQLMSLLDVDLTQMQEIVGSGIVDINLLQDICTTLSQIEIESSLGTENSIDKSLVEKLSSQLETLVQPIKNQEVNLSDNVNQTFEALFEKIEALLKQSDMTIESKGQTVDSQNAQMTENTEITEIETTLLFDKLKALTNKSSDLKLKEASVTVDSQSNAKATKQTETILGVASDSSLSKMTSDKNTMSGTVTEVKGNETTENSKMDRVETVVTVSENGDLVVTKNNTESNTIIDQVMMKQPSSITNGTQNTATSALRQNVFNQIMDAVKTNIKLDDNGSHMLMKLKPEQLGSVELKISIHKGVVLAEINVENEMVKATVESNLDDLKQSLSQKGYQLNQINVSVDSGKKEQEQQFAFNKGSKSKKEATLDEIEALAETLFNNSGYQNDLYETSTINYYA